MTLARGDMGLMLARGHARARPAARIRHERPRVEVDEGGTPTVTTLPTRDRTLPDAFSDALEKLSLAPLWAALHPVAASADDAGGPHHWRWADLRGPLIEAARLVGIEQAERRVLVS